MERTPRTVLITTLGILFFILILIFGYNRFGRYINGPEIVEISIEEYQTIADTRIEITGQVHNVQNISMNNRDLILADDKKFREIIVVSPGKNILEIDVVDPFGKEREYIYHIYSTQEKDTYPNSYSQAQELQTEENQEDTVDDTEEEITE
jgi:hypothetical protein